MGDVIETTPLLDVLRKHYPDARIDYATTDYARPALKGNPDVSSVIPPEIAALRAGRYDVSITLERSPAAGVLPWRAGIPIRVGPNSRGRGFAHNLRVACPPGRSEAELYLACAEALDVPIDGARARYVPSAVDIARADELLASHGVSGKPIAIAPGSSTTLLSKRWPASCFAQLATALVQQTGATVFLLGATDDAAACAEVAAAAGPQVINLAQKTSFSEMAAVIVRSRLFVGNDSSPLHLAAAVGTPFVGIFGPTDPVRHRPFGQGEIVAAPLPASAYRNGFASVDCIEMVSVEAAVTACLRVLDLHES